MPYKDPVKQKEYFVKYDAARSVKARIYKKSYYLQHKQERKSYSKIYRESHREEKNAGERARWARNKDSLNEKQRVKYDTNPQYKLSIRLRNRVVKALNGGLKSGSAIRDMGCTVEELKKHLESKFKPGMSWDNWSFYGWHIDHIKPLVSFDLTNRKQLLKAIHYTNLQPLWKFDNLSKGKKL